MSTLTIINASLLTSCMKYTFQYTWEVQPTKPSKVRYTDCEGLIKEVDVSIGLEGEIPPPVTICALNILNIGGQVDDITDYGNQQSCNAPLTFVETLRQDNSDTCGQTLLEFEVTGNVNNYPFTLEYNGSPSGASVFINKLGTSGTGIFRLASDNTNFLVATQPKDGNFNLFSEKELLLTNTGTTKFRFIVQSSDTMRAPNNQIVLLRCDNIEGMTATSTFASAALLPLDPIPQTLSIDNNRTMYYQTALGGN